MASVNGGLVANQNKSQNIQTMVHPKNILANENMKKKFTEILGKKAPAFMGSILSLYNSDNKFKDVDGYSVINAALLAATLDLPINKEFGFAWIIPYKNQAQFQVGYKGYIQLALRTGQYKNLNVIEIFEDQLKFYNPLTEEIELDLLSADYEVGSKKIKGYAFYMRLLNGFEKTIYWPIERVTSHAKRFSKTYKNGPWQTDFDAMAKKTILKNGLSKWGILSVEMQKAIETDQATIEKAINSLDDLSHDSVKYLDNPENESKKVIDTDYKNEEQKDIYKDTPFEGE
ncbi:recombinase RecT [Clostridium gasigenes]|uniref:Recombinase RecT n=1 Tax=Clostridium gasigenes TaxID=94869 RepID=A0A7X0SEQ2_9CLOT|nr:recombinase RecT [Clostridium gasigenes]MBB6716229.1 recombinase RecT [Clostridium gasigenes]